jgi:hypothetical protein
MTEKPEKRRYPRYEVEDVRGRLRTSVEGRVTNLSMQGMALETHQWLSVGRSYTVKLEADGQEVNLNGIVAWCRLAHLGRSETADGGAAYEAGIEFDDVVTEKAEQLFDVIADRGVTRLERRAHGRFTVVGAEPVSMEARPEFLVRKVSRSGMLIESEHVPDVEDRLDADINLEDRVLEARFRVAYVHHIRNEEGRPAAEIGVELEEMPGKDRKAYERMIDRALRA